MLGDHPLVSIVCPVFEEEGLPIFHRHLVESLLKLESEFRFEILYVDDGSTDSTLENLKDLAAHDARIGYLSFSRNFGHQAALTAGLEHARGDAVISMDSDLQHPPELIAELLANWQAGFDVVVTMRAQDERLSLFKRLSSLLFYRFMKYLSDTEIRTAASDFRLLSRRAVTTLNRMDERHRFIRGLVQWLGFPSKEIVYHPNERCAGVSKYTFRRMLRLAGDGVFSFSKAPLKLPLCLLVFFGGLGIIHAALAVIFLATSNSASAGWHYQLVVLTCGLAGLLSSVAIQGEYLGRVHTEIKHRPNYILKESTFDAPTILKFQSGKRIAG